MKESFPKKETREQEHALKEGPYEEDGGSVAFVMYKREERITATQQGAISKRTKTEVISTGTHVPCHDILLKIDTGEYQALHIDGATLRPTLEQKSGLEKAIADGAEAIIIKGRKSTLTQKDIDDLEKQGLKIKKMVEIDTKDWWKLLYDPVTDEIWIDKIREKEIERHKGFEE